MARVRGYLDGRLVGAGVIGGMIATVMILVLPPPGTSFCMIPPCPTEVLQPIPWAVCIASRFAFAQVLIPSNWDSDGDGLPDLWEARRLVDSNRDGITDLYLTDTDPCHKDLYVEVDYMSLHKPTDQAIQDVILAFARAPVPNPDGKRGVNLHIQIDEEIPHEDLVPFGWGLNQIRDSFFGTAAQRASVNAQNILTTKAEVYRYGLFLHQIDWNGFMFCAGGMTDHAPDRTFYVSLGCVGAANDSGHRVGTVIQQAETFMHELGHALGLRHGGADNFNCKPNYLSKMSYSRFEWLLPGAPLDFSSTYSVLNETALNEAGGIVGPHSLQAIHGPGVPRVSQVGVPIDWNRDGAFTDGVAANITSMDTSAIDPTFMPCQDGGMNVLESINDWTSLKYKVPGS